MDPQRSVDVVPHRVVGLALQVGDAEKFTRTIGFKSLDPFLKVSKQGPCLTAVEEDEGDKKSLIQLKLSREADALASPAFV